MLITPDRCAQHLGGTTAPGMHQPTNVGMHDWDATPHISRFTGKERDTESGLDYFGARYFSSAIGRFVTPDWAAAATEVPYADFGDPQSLNLYGYVRSNPLSQVDSDGHAPDIAVIENGPTTSWQDRLETTNGNPVGHTAIAITGKGVYSFGNDAPLGSSASNYVSKQAADRSTTIYIIRTTPEQDDAAAKYLSDKSGQKLGVAIDNCSSRSNGALDAAAIPKLSTPSCNSAHGGYAGNGCERSIRHQHPWLGRRPRCSCGGDYRYCSAKFDRNPRTAQTIRTQMRTVQDEAERYPIDISLNCGRVNWAGRNLYHLESANER